MANIVLIDDDQCLRRLIAEMLRIEGHTVREAADGAEGLAFCNCQRLDLVITDIVMPKKDGIETMLALSRADPSLPVLAISGASCASLYLSAARGLGAACLTKPFDREQLLEAVGDLLSRKGNYHA